MSTYHKNTPAVAAVRRNDEAEQHEAFVRDVQSLARRLYLSCPSASADDKQFLQDVTRGRYGFKAMERLIRIGQLSYRPEHRLAVASLAERYANPDGELPPSVYAAFSDELDAQCAADVAQRQFEHAPTSATRESVLERLTAQVIATRRAIQAVVAFPIR